MPNRTADDSAAAVYFGKREALFHSSTIDALGRSWKRSAARRPRSIACLGDPLFHLLSSFYRFQALLAARVCMYIYI